MTEDKIRIREAEGTWVVRAGGAVIAETSNALELSEEGYKDVIYFPRDGIAMAVLDASDKTSHCPHKGDAEYFHVVTKSTVIENAAWSYPSPKGDVARIAGHLAFYPSPQVTIERV